MPLENLDLAMRWLAYPVGAAIFANQIDDLFIDANYLLRGLHRRARRVVPAEELRRVEQKRVAILLPAWKEADVVGRMIEHNLATIEYDRANCDIFCGTYQNDPETQACVDAVARRFRSVHKVVVPHDGPTSKADCLNWVYQGIVLEEKRHGARYQILLMHDAEDIIHPLSLRLYSLLIPRYEFVQTPVFSLELKCNQFVAGTYIDEFSEHHLKELLVRHAIGGLVPSAGVGSAFEREAFDQIALAHQQQPFNPSSLTEDYEIGVKFRLAGKRVCFACHTIEHEVLEHRGLFRRRPVRVKREEYIATREYFPAALGASVRQRSRWILGITLQAWEQMGWRGALPVLYCLWRDRKGLLNNLLLLLAYLFLAYVLGRSAAEAVRDTEWEVSRLVPPASLLSMLLMVNLGAVAWRGSIKMGFVRRLYGAGQSLFVVPRLVVANLISLLATARAVRMYLRHRLTGQPLRWLKTAHAFPSAETLRARQLSFGEFLVERESEVAPDIEAAVALQKRLDLPLGELLTVSGVLPERRVMLRLAEHLEVPVRHPDPAEIPAALLKDLSEAEAEDMEVLPLARRGTDRVLVAVARPLPPEHRARLEQRLRARVEPVLTVKRALQRARCVAYRRLNYLAPVRPRLGEQLVERGRLDAGDLPALLEEQLETREMLGEMLLRQGRMSIQALSDGLRFDGGFRTVAAGDGDGEAVARLGYGRCALYSLVPLVREGSRGRRVVASAFPVHAQEKAALAQRLGEAVEVTLAPVLQIRIALAMAGVFVPGVSGMDQLEIAALHRRGLMRPSLRPRRGPRAAGGASPLVELESVRAIDPETAALVRSDVLGLSIAPAAEGTRGPSGMLPPRLEARRCIQVRQVEPGSLMLAAPRPSPALAREVADLLPGWRIAWQIAPMPLSREVTDDDRAA